MMLQTKKDREINKIIGDVYFKGVYTKTGHPVGQGTLEGLANTWLPYDAEWIEMIQNGHWLHLLQMLNNVDPGVHFEPLVRCKWNGDMPAGTVLDVLLKTTPNMTFGEIVAFIVNCGYQLGSELETLNAANDLFDLGMRGIEYVR